MDNNKLDYINKLIDELKVVSYSERDIKSDTSFIRLKSGKYKLNNGEIIEREGVIKCSDVMNAVVIFAVTCDGNILMVIQPRVFLPDKNKVTIEMPAGYVDGEESVIDAAKRELFEETGYVSNDLFLIDSFYPSLGYSGEDISIVLAVNCKKCGDQDLDKDEFINYFNCNVSEIKYLIDNGYIVDATTKLAYYEVLEYLTSNNMLNFIGR